MAVNAEQNFRSKAPEYMGRLIADFQIMPEDAAAIMGNLGHESAGLTILQEIKPTVPGSKGGFGWAQWTGPRRRAFEAYCARTGKDPASDEANYAYLFLELKGIEGSEKNAIPRLKAAEGLDAKVEAFEQAFLRAGVKHYPSRTLWARIAPDAWNKSSVTVPPATPSPPDGPAPHAEDSGNYARLVIILAVAIVVSAAIIFFNAR